jgi:16S rRNA (cytosine967-C5)-methyltransferase
VPDWLAPRLQAALGADFAPVMQALRHRAPVFLRVNTARRSAGARPLALAGEGLRRRRIPLAKTLPWK